MKSKLIGLTVLLLAGLFMAACSEDIVNNGLTEQRNIEQGEDINNETVTDAPTLPEEILVFQGPFGLEMVQIPAGTITIEPWEKATYDLTVNAFKIGKYEVTQEQFEAVMGFNPSYFDGKRRYAVSDFYDPRETWPGEVQGRRPVECVSWYDAIAFCNRLSMIEGLTPVYLINGSANPDDWETIPYYDWERMGYTMEFVLRYDWDVEIASGSTGYRLPTEMQWEYACRAGSTTYWHFGHHFGNNDAKDQLVNYAWYWGSFPNARTHEVGKKLPNAWGLYDMYGNVMEWCQDLMVHPGYTGPGAQARVQRGGSWHTSDWSLINSGHRNADFQVCSINNHGFRVVLP